MNRKDLSFTQRIRLHPIRFQRLSTGERQHDKFAPVHSEVAYEFEVFLDPQITNSEKRLSVKLVYNVGAWARLNLEYLLTVRRPDRQYVIWLNGNVQLILDDDAEKNEISWPNFITLDRSELRDEYGIDFDDEILICLRLKFPADAFEYQIEYPSVSQHPIIRDAQLARFEKIHSPHSDSDRTFISGDGSMFYCERSALDDAFLSAVFKKRIAAGDSHSFGNLTKDTLEALVCYLYTWQHISSIDRLSLVDTIDLARFCHQYDLDIVTRACEASLWNIAVKLYHTSELVQIFMYANEFNRVLELRVMDLLNAERADEFRTVLQRHCGGMTPLYERFMSRKVGFRCARVYYDMDDPGRIIWE